MPNRVVMCWASAAAVVLLAASGSALPAGAATKPTYVAIVVSGHVTACVPWHAGLTGDEVLNAVADVHYRPTDGIIVQIDGQPSPASADNDHYWSYWHSSGGGWSYSNVGASGYSPAAGTVEGWRFVNGGTKAPPDQNAAGLYAASCASKDPKPARSSRSQMQSAPAPGPGPAARTRAHASSGARGGNQLSARSSERPRGRVTSSIPALSAVRTSASASSSPTRDASRIQSGAASSTGPIVLDSSPAAAEPKSTSGSALPVVIGFVLAAVLGGIGWWAALRRRRFGAG